MVCNAIIGDSYCDKIFHYNQFHPETQFEYKFCPILGIDSDPTMMINQIQKQKEILLTLMIKLKTGFLNQIQTNQRLMDLISKIF